MLKLDGYTLKWIAIAGMVLSHLTYAFWDAWPMSVILPLGALGGLTFPIMAFFLVEGYRHTSNIKRYVLRLVLFGVIATPFHIMVIGLPTLNIMFTLAVGLGTLALYDKMRRWVFWLVFLILIIPVSTMVLEFQFLGVTTILLYHIIRKERLKRIIPPVFMGIIGLLVGSAGWVHFAGLEAYGVALPEVDGGIFRNAHFMTDPDFMFVTILFSIVILFVPVLLMAYTGERGRRMHRYTFYVIYPLHLAILAGFAFVFNGGGM